MFPFFFLVRLADQPIIAAISSLCGKTASLLSGRTRYPSLLVRDAPGVIQHDAYGGQVSFHAGLGHRVVPQTAVAVVQAVVDIDGLIAVNLHDDVAVIAVAGVRAQVAALGGYHAQQVHDCGEQPQWHHQEGCGA